MNVITAGLCSQCTILAGQTGMTFTDGKSAGPDQVRAFDGVAVQTYRNRACISITFCLQI
jgi:hypothetical protein